jgi:hypothetical protein
MEGEKAMSNRDGFTRSLTGRLINERPEIQNFPGTFAAKLEMLMAGCDKKPILEWIRTEFNLPPELQRECTQFFLRIWTGSYVLESVQEGILYGRADNWIVHWQSTPAVVRSAARVACSFREYQGKKYVVIKVWKNQGEAE